VFDLEELSLKSERVTDSENIDFCVCNNPSLILLVMGLVELIK